MNKLLDLAATGVAVFVFMYCSIAFVVWDFNAANWSEDSRLALVWFGVLLGAPAIAWRSAAK